MKARPACRLLRRAAALLGLFALGACSLALPGRPAVTPAAPQGGSEPADECANPYFPVVQGAAWTYRASGRLSGTLLRLITAVKPDGFTDQHSLPSGGAQTITWECSDGILSGQPDTGPSGLLSAGDLDAHLHATETSGVTVPDNLGPAAYWNQESTLDGVVPLQPGEAPAHVEMRTECTAGAQETVVVPAGSFSALRAECETHEELTVTLNGAAIPAALVTESTIWYAPGVGVVRLEQAVTNGARTTLELVSYRIP